ncbi:MAG: hypothetical protein SPF19_10335 [Oliverpabstia sp.]|nr:hypothetical protein [Oliverpabstia sp.]
MQRLTKKAERLPLYEHNVDASVMEKLIGKEFAGLYEGDDRDLEEFFSYYCGFFRDYGYDVVTFEGCIGQILPGGGALGNCRITPAIQSREDFEKYPWDEIPELYFQNYGRYFSALRKQRVMAE